MTDENEPALVILARPQISATLNGCDEIEISTARINADFQGVGHDEVVIPLADVREVAETMLALLKARGG